MDGIWIDDLMLVKNELKNYYHKLFQRQGRRWPSTSLCSFKSLSEPQRISLVIPFTREEIKKVVWECRGDKAPGPYEFVFEFIHWFWDIIQDDVVFFVIRFFEDEKNSKGV